MYASHSTLVLEIYVIKNESLPNTTFASAVGVSTLLLVIYHQTPSLIFSFLDGLCLILSKWNMQLLRFMFRNGVDFCLKFLLSVLVFFLCCHYLCFSVFFKTKLFHTNEKSGRVLLYS